MQTNKQPIPSRLATIATLAAAFALPVLCAAQQQPFPTHPLRFVTSNTAGSSTDILYRMVADGVAADLGQPVITENRPGSGGLISASTIAKAAPDGYTIGMGGSGPLAVGPLLRPAPYDPIKSFTHMGLLSEIPLALTVSSSLNVNTVQELLAYAKANPGKLNFGSNGIGSTPHLALEWMKLRFGVDMVHVPFKGDDDVQGFRNGQIQVTMVSGSAVASMEKQGIVKILATLGRRRDPSFPNTPSAADAGVPDFIVEAWLCVMGPAGLSREYATRVNRAVATYLGKPDIAAKTTAMLYNIRVSSPEEQITLMTAEIARWKEVIEKAKIKVD